MNKPSLLKYNPVYKPFQYPWCFENWQLQQQLHWVPEEVSLGEDVADWKLNLSEQEKNLLTQIFRFFTQADIEVNDCYLHHYLRVLQPVEVKMMLTAFANIETVHIAAYSYLLDTIGMPETEYSAFLQYSEMKEKHEFMRKFGSETPFDFALTMAVFGAFTEGLQLFASFAMLLNFPRFNKMKGMGQIISWSVRDETLHCNSIVRLWHSYVSECELDRSELEKAIVEECDSVIRLEDNFIDLAFGMGQIEGLRAEEVKNYIRYIANRRLSQLGFSMRYYLIETENNKNDGENRHFIEENPLPWMDDMLQAVEHTNFFENRATEYTKSATTGTWEEAFA